MKEFEQHLTSTEGMKVNEIGQVVKTPLSDNMEKTRKELECPSSSAYRDALRLCKKLEGKIEEMKNLTGKIEFYKGEARAWKALYDRQRGGAAFDEMQKELVETKKALREALSEGQTVVDRLFGAEELHEIEEALAIALDDINDLAEIPVDKYGFLKGSIHVKATFIPEAGSAGQ